jgi:membrane associated rhomboid family serine protease
LLSFFFLRFTVVCVDLLKLFRGEIWRLFSSFLVFQNFAQLSVGMLLLYTCRQFERQMGSKKFGAFLVFSYAVSTLISIAAVVVASSIGFILVPSSGPFSLIYALLVLYYCKDL